jgi:antibiotic biosynthesis monooxygenase (ABM) superfamily enzyme
MYGTVAKFRLKPGMEAKLHEAMQIDEAAKIPGYVRSVLYRMDADANEYYLAVVFDSKDAYNKNADSPEQDARYREFAAIMEGDPEWHDGEVVWS